MKYPWGFTQIDGTLSVCLLSAFNRCFASQRIRFPSRILSLPSLRVPRFRAVCFIGHKRIPLRRRMNCSQSIFFSLLKNLLESPLLKTSVGKLTFFWNTKTDRCLIFNFQAFSNARMSPIFIGIVFFVGETWTRDECFVESILTGRDFTTGYHLRLSQ